jgi:hypothetical protein
MFKRIKTSNEPQSTNSNKDRINQRVFELRIKNLQKILSNQIQGI